MRGGFEMRKYSNKDLIQPQQEEPDAPLSSASLFSFQRVYASLERRSLLLKQSYLVLMDIVTILYLIRWFRGLLKP
jgi:hypothetical protein